MHSLADAIARAATQKDVDYLTTYLDKVLAVTAADVQRAAKKYLAEESAVVIWSLPAAEGKGGEGGKPGSPRRAGRTK